MAYTFTQTGAEIQTILNQVGTNTSDISSINDTLAQSVDHHVSDCDDATDAYKIYAADGSTANRPTGSGYWTIVPIRYSNSFIFQLAFLVNSQTPSVYGRNSNGAGQWGSWRIISGGATASCSYGTVTTVKPSYAINSGIGILYFSFQLPAGTYEASDELWTLDPPPRDNQISLMKMGTSYVHVRVETSGKVRLNNAITLNSSAYILGQIVFRV